MNISGFLTFALFAAIICFGIAWVTILPTIGLLYVVGYVH